MLVVRTRGRFWSALRTLRPAKAGVWRGTAAGGWKEEQWVSTRQEAGGRSTITPRDRRLWSYDRHEPNVKAHG